MADYDLTAGTMVLQGDVLLSKGRQRAGRRAKLVINLKDGTARMEGRVRTVFQPGGN